MKKPVDMLELHRVQKDVRHQMHMLGLFAQKGSDEFNKVVVSLAWQFTDLNAIEEAVDLLVIVPADYYQNVLPRQMEQDPVFAAVAAKVANTLVEANVAEHEFAYPRHLIQRGMGLA